MGALHLFSSLLGQKYKEEQNIDSTNILEQQFQISSLRYIFKSIISIPFFMLKKKSQYPDDNPNKWRCVILKEKITIHSSYSCRVTRLVPISSVHWVRGRKSKYLL